MIKIKPVERAPVRRIIITDEMRARYKSFGESKRARKKKPKVSPPKPKKKVKLSRSFLRSEEWKRVRYQAIARYGRTCMACGKSAPHVIIHVDHIKPRSRYPELALDLNNLQILCADCNFGKGADYEDDFRPEEPDFLTDAARIGVSNGSTDQDDGRPVHGNEDPD